MLKAEIVDELVKSPKYKGQSKFFLMKKLKKELQDMLDHIDDPIQEVKTESKINKETKETKEVKQTLSKEQEREILDNDLTFLKTKYQELYPKEFSRFDWDNTGDNSCLKTYIRQWRGKLRLKGYDLSKLEMRSLELI